MAKFEDLTGRRFERLVVVAESHRGKLNKAYWLCKCDCGGEKVILGESLKSGRTRSCGCLHLESSNKNLPPPKHGLYGTKVYQMYSSMIARCHRKSDTNYKYYGARGIKVCDEWRHNFTKFIEDMGFKPGPEYSLDRIDTYGNYSKENCRWATAKEQSNNKTVNRYITMKGVIKTATEWAEDFGLNPGTVLSRLSRGKSLDRVFSTKNHKYRKSEQTLKHRP